MDGKGRDGMVGAQDGAQILPDFGSLTAARLVPHYGML